jgi:hypothetical protein
MDLDLLRFLGDEIRSHPKSDVASWQLTLCRLLNRSIRDGMPVKLPSELTFRTIEEHVRNSEEALLAALSCCSTITESTSELVWPNSSGAGAFIHRLRGQRFGRAGVVMESLGTQI